MSVIVTAPVGLVVEASMIRGVSDLGGSKIAKAVETLLIASRCGGNGG